MDPVEYHLILVFYRWCGLRPPAYGPSSSLAGMWSSTSSAPYVWDGVTALLRKIYQEPFFQDCPRAHELTPPMFGPGGGIQTVSALYFFLRPCGNVL